jgi:hypothetical protein
MNAIEFDMPDGRRYRISAPGLALAAKDKGHGDLLADFEADAEEMRREAATLDWRDVYRYAEPAEPLADIWAQQWKNAGKALVKVPDNGRIPGQPNV